MKRLSRLRCFCSAVLFVGANIAVRPFGVWPSHGGPGAQIAPELPRETSLACGTIHPAMGRASQQPPQQPPLHQSALPAMPNYSASESQSPAPAVRVSVPAAASHVTASRINSAPSSELQLPPDALHCPPPPSQLPTAPGDQSLPTHSLSLCTPPTPLWHSCRCRVDPRTSLTHLPPVMGH